MRRWKLRKYEWNEESGSLVIAREWEIQADRIEAEGHSPLRAYRGPSLPGIVDSELVYVSRDWDEVTLIEEGQDV